jgi:hypothetical protein
MLSSQTLPELIGFNEAFKDREMPHFGVQTHNISQRGLIVCYKTDHWFAQTAGSGQTCKEVKYRGLFLVRFVKCLQDRRFST